MLSVKESLPHSQSVALEIFNLVERGRVRAEWRSVWRGSGGLHVCDMHSVFGREETLVVCRRLGIKTSGNFSVF